MHVTSKKGSDTFADLHNSVMSPARFHSIQMHCGNASATSQGCNTPSKGQNPCIRVCGTRWSWELWEKHLNNWGKRIRFAVCRQRAGEQQRTAWYMLPSHGWEHTVQAPINAEFGLNEQKDNWQTICFNTSEVKVSNNYLMLWRKSNNAVGLMLPIQARSWAWILLVCLHQTLDGSPTPWGGTPQISPCALDTASPAWQFRLALLFQGVLQELGWNSFHSRKHRREQILTITNLLLIRTELKPLESQS